MRDLVVGGVRFERDLGLDKSLVLKRLRKRRLALIEQPASFLHMGQREVRDPVQEFDIALREAGGVDVADALAQNAQGRGHEGGGGGGGDGVRSHALIVAKKACFAIRYFRANQN